MSVHQVLGQRKDCLQPVERNWKRLVLMLIGASVFVLLLVILCPHAKVAYLAYRVHSAKTSDEERVAFALVARWSPHGTVIAFLDSQGHDLGSPGTFNYQEVTAVQIHWTCGGALQHELLDNQNLVTLLGE